MPKSGLVRLALISAGLLCGAVVAAWKAAAITVTAIVLVAGLGVLAGGAVAAIAALGSAVVAAVVLLLRARPVRKAWSERHGPQARWLAVGAPPASDPAEFMEDDGANGTDAFGGQQ